VVTGEEIPERSKFWFRHYFATGATPRIFDQITIVYCLVLAIFAFVVFWPIISKIKFEEAFFTPLAPFLIYLLSSLGFSANDAIRILFTVSLIVSTVGVYLLARDLTKRQVVPILASLIYLLPPIPVFVLTFFKRGLFEVELASARSFFSVVYGDGAHFLALAIIPFAMLFFIRYLKSGSRGDLLLTVVCGSLILLANRSQSVSLFLILGVCALAEIFLSRGWEKIKRLLLVIVLCVGLVSFWYTPDFWVKSIGLFSEQLTQNFKFLFPLPFTLVVLSFFLSVVFFAKQEDRQPIFMSFLLFALFALITFDWFMNQRSYIAHPYRLLPNLNMFTAVTVALALGAIFDKLRLSQKFAFEVWPIFLRVLGALAFGIVSFMTLAVVAQTIFPYMLLVLSGPSGLWIKISQNITSDRKQALDLAGENFRLVGTQDFGHYWFGILLSFIFLILLVLLVTGRGKADAGSQSNNAGFKEV